MDTYFWGCNQNIIDKATYVNKNPNRGGIFLDRDGTIIAEKKYLRDIADLEFLPGAIPGLKILATTGLPLYIFTNQAGVAHGFFNEETLNQIHKYLISKLFEAGIMIRGLYYCPHHPNAEIEKYRHDCECRKPKPGLLKIAARIDHLDLSKSYIIGDKISDLSAGKQVAAKTALVLTGYGLAEYKKITPEVVPDYVAHNLKDVAQWLKANIFGS
jgi:D-glycero-D-manno-heptose 1,7-bisphosphate phosphatase